MGLLVKLGEQTGQNKQITVGEVADTWSQLGIGKRGFLLQHESIFSLKCEATSCEPRILFSFLLK